VAKLLYFQCFSCSSGSPGAQIVVADPLTICSPASMMAHSSGAREPVASIPGMNSPGECYAGARDLGLFYASIRVYFNPSNTGTWSQDLGFLLGTQVGELARHVGRHIAIKESGASSENHLVAAAAPLHGPTVRYLIGIFSSLVLEMLFSKNSTLAQIAANCLKSIAPIYPEIFESLLPLLLATLDPSAVSKSHMAMPAMWALSFIFKSCLHPRPVILPYLPDLLRLSLPGVDPNDFMKTMNTLNLYIRVLSWMPILDAGSDELSLRSSIICSPTLLELATSEKSTLRGGDYRTLMDNANGAMIEWAPMFIDKLMAILEALDGNKASGNSDRADSKGPSHSQSHSHVNKMLQPVINQCADLLFAAASGTIAEELCNKVLGYVKASSPVQATKELSSIIESICTSHANKLLPHVLVSLIDPSVRAGSCSAEKLAFRLQLTGGALRKAGSTNLLELNWYGRHTASGEKLLESAVDFLRAFMEPEYTIRHSDKDVKHASRKLLRDVFRGLSSTYAITPRPRAAAVAVKLSDFVSKQEVKEIIFHHFFVGIID
jgi:hypothetical protein